MSTTGQNAPASTRLGASRAVSLIARREISTRVRARSFLITNALLLVVIIGGLIVASIFTGGDDKPEKIGVVGTNTALSQSITAAGQVTGTKVEIVPLADAAQARTQVDAGDVSVAVAPGQAGGAAFTAVTKDGLSGTSETIVRTAIAQLAQQQALARNNIDPAAFAAAQQAGNRLDVTETTPAKADEGQRLAIAYVGVILLLFAIMTGGGMVSAGVVEEKTSRVVELLLATIRPLHLLWGKILGIGAITFGQLVVLGGAGLITASVTGLLTVPGAAVSMLAAVVVWFLLGFLFFATLYAATGAMVSRQEELGSTAAPLTILSLGVLYAGIFGINALDSTFIKVLSWIPPFSASLMPMRIAAGETDTVQVIGTVVIMVVACLAAVWAASRIYQRSILQTGSKVRWADALKGSAGSAPAPEKVGVTQG
ncbi:MAG: ABC transporter permease [Corynebacteriales bacterium]|nr:ABC transporter permease [Mycobacteriales bacterium]